MFDADHAVVGMGEAADMLGVQPAFLRSLDAAGVLSPERSSGGHRRYSHNQLAAAARLRELLDEGFATTAAGRILELELELRDALERISALERALHQRDSAV